MGDAAGLVRGRIGQWLAPKLGEAGTDDCPACDDTGFDLQEIDTIESIESIESLAESDAA